MVTGRETGNRHDYRAAVIWTGNLGEGTASYAAYSRDHDVTGQAKPTIPGTADPAFRGDPTRWNPEELLVASLSQCHMLEFLAQAARAGVVVTRYVDEPSGTMVEADDGGSFVEVILRPRVTVAHDDMVDACARFHEEAHRACYIASSVVFPVRLEPVTEVDGRPASAERYTGGDIRPVAFDP
jgi:organic hydroperoxide reductase OsmC/OhrA